MTRKDGCEPGVYMLILLLEELIKIGMSNNVTTGMNGRVNRQLPNGITPEQCSAILMKRADTVKMMKSAPQLDSIIKAFCKVLPAFQYKEDQNDQSYAEASNQVMESVLMSILVRSEERKVDVGLGLERLLNTGSKFINYYCHFPDSDFGDNAWIANYSSRSVSTTANTTWITVPSELYEKTDACNDPSTIKGMRNILKERPRGEYVTNYMYEDLMEASANELWGGSVDAITTNPVIEFVSNQIDDIATVLRDDSLDVDGEHRSESRRLLRDIIKKFDNSTRFKYDFQEPDEKELARKSANLTRKRIEEEKKKLEGKPSNATAVIYIEQCAINAIEKQSWGPNALRGLISSKSNEKKAM
eukprot:scaffold16738_cov217-Skeletonema_dohrnii-CCMP3373.AAC.1